MNVGGYTISGLLGRGGSGTVYAAWDGENRREVALKRLPAELVRAAFPGGDLAEHCRRALAVRHRCLNRLTGVFEIAPGQWVEQCEPGDVVVASERIYGVTLDDVLAGREVLSPPELAYLMAELGAALGALHKAGLAHGDVSPANVLVRADGSVQLIDWFLGGRGERGTPGLRHKDVAAGEHGNGQVSEQADAVALAKLTLRAAGSTGGFATEIARILAPWLGRAAAGRVGTVWEGADAEGKRPAGTSTAVQGPGKGGGQDAVGPLGDAGAQEEPVPGLYQLGARASEISGGREPIHTEQGAEMAGEAMRRAALNAPTAGKHRPAVVSARGGKWAARKAVRVGALALGVVLIAGGVLTQMPRPTAAVPPATPPAAQQAGNVEGGQVGAQARRGEQGAAEWVSGQRVGAKDGLQDVTADAARGGRNGAQEAPGPRPEGESAVRPGEHNVAGTAALAETSVSAGGAEPERAVGGERPGGCEQFAALSHLRDAAIAARDAQQLAGVYAPGAAARARDVELIGALRRDGIEVRGLSNRIAACTDTGEQDLEVSTQQLAYQWRVGTGQWQEAPAAAPQLLRVRLEDGKVAELTPQERR